MSEHPKAVRAMLLANASTLVVSLENLHALREGLLAMHKDFKQLLREQEADEVRHAEEMRELKERFEAFRQEVSEAAQSMETAMRTGAWQGVALDRLKQFILPAPNPLVEAVGDALEGQGMGRPSHTTTEITARLRAAIEARGGKIVWEAGE